METSVFLSHAVADEKIAATVTRLLATGLNITGKSVFCSSLPGRSIPGGFDFIDHIQAQLKSAKVVILLMTENYLASQFCMAEVGAAWISKERVIPLIVPPYSRSKLKATLAVTQAWRINDAEDLNEFADDITEALSLTIRHAQWDVEKKAFLGSIQKEIDDQIPPQTVDIADYEKLKKEAEYSITTIDDLRTELERKDELIQSIKTAKDSDEVRKIELDSMEEMDGFLELADELSKRTNDLPSAASDALYHYVRGETVPIPQNGNSSSSDDWREIEIAVRKNMLSEHPPYELNGDHPKIRKAMTALNSLSSFMRENEEELRPRIEDEYEMTYSLGDEDFWNQFIG